MTPIQRLSSALDDLDEKTFLSLPYPVRKVVYAAIDVEKAYMNFLVEEKQKVIPFPLLITVK